MGGLAGLGPVLHARPGWPQALPEMAPPLFGGMATAAAGWGGAPPPASESPPSTGENSRALCPDSGSLYA